MKKVKGIIIIKGKNYWNDSHVFSYRGAFSNF